MAYATYGTQIQCGASHPKAKCGWHWGKLDLSTRVVVCDNCGAVHDRLRRAVGNRDENASKNIEQVGMGQVT